MVRRPRPARIPDMGWAMHPRITTLINQARYPFRHGPREVKAHCQLDSTASGYLEQAIEQMNFSAHAHDRMVPEQLNQEQLTGS
jgi:hypothetical protein